MFENITGWVLAIVVLGASFASSANESVYISHLYVYQSSLPQVTGCGSDINCELALDRAWAEAMSWDKLLDERVYP